MEALRQITEINPLLVLAVISAVYFFALFLRRDTGTALFSILALILLGLLFLPQGQALQSRMNDLPRGGERWRCWTATWTSGDILSSEKIKTSKQCDYSSPEIFSEEN